MANPLDRAIPSNAIGENGLRQLIDETNKRRAKSGQRKRFRPALIGQVLTMQEFEEFPRPANPNTESPTYADAAWSWGNGR